MKYIIAFLLLLFLPLAVSAMTTEHSVISGEFQIDGIFYPDFIESGEAIGVQFILSDLNGVRVKDATVWVSLSQNGTTIFSSSDLVAEDGVTDLELFFPYAGEYKLVYRAIDARSKKEATMQKSIVVQPSPEQLLAAKEETQSRRSSNFNLAVLTLILGVFAGIILGHYRPTNKESSSTEE